MFVAVKAKHLDCNLGVLMGFLKERLGMVSFAGKGVLICKRCKCWACHKQSREAAPALSNLHAWNMLVCVVLPPTISVFSSGWGGGRGGGGSEESTHHP